MKTLSKTEKGIIKMIQEKKIVDIFSYVTQCGECEVLEYDQNEVIEAFKKEYEGSDYCLCYYDKKLVYLSELPQDEQPVLRMMFGNDTCYTFPCKEDKFSYDIFSRHIVCKDFNKILQFISLWQYLESEGLIINLPKKCAMNDLALFLYKKKREKAYQRHIEKSTKDSLYTIDARTFLQWDVAINTHNVDLCMSYLEKQMLPTLGLNQFIKNGYKTKSDLNDSRNFKIALVGIIVAIITSIASIVISLSDKGYYKELQDINNSIREIREELHIETETQDVLDE